MSWLLRVRLHLPAASLIHLLLLLILIQSVVSWSPVLNKKNTLSNLFPSRVITRRIQALPPLQQQQQSGAAESSSSSDGSVWASRRQIARTVLSPLATAALRREQKQQQQQLEAVATAETTAAESDSKNSLLGQYGSSSAVATFVLAVAALTLRLGGRGAFVSLLGLDFIADSQLKQQLDALLSTFQGLATPQQLLLFLLAWMAAKLVCIDALSVVLALSSGLLFGGLLQGTVASVACSTTASLALFLAARYFFKERAQEQIARRPALRAIDRALNKNGLKTVFTLRLSPLLPIPIALYNYLYGVMSVSAADFVIGTSVASIKPYFLDCYLGMFGKSVLDASKTQGDASQAAAADDYWLLLVVAVVLLVGSLATQLVADTWQEIQQEIIAARLQQQQQQQRGDRCEIEDRAAGVFDTTTAAANLAATTATDIAGTTATSTDVIAADIAATSSVADVSLFELLGISDEELPQWLREVKGNADQAWQRIDAVIAEEWRILLAMKRDETIDDNEDTTATVRTAPTATAAVDTEEEKLRRMRQIRDFELQPPGPDNVVQYTYESLAYSFVLISAAFKYAG